MKSVKGEGWRNLVDSTYHGGATGDPETMKKVMKFYVKLGSIGMQIYKISNKFLN